MTATKSAMVFRDGNGNETRAAGPIEVLPNQGVGGAGLSADSFATLASRFARARASWELRKDEVP